LDVTPSAIPDKLYTIGSPAMTFGYLRFRDSSGQCGVFLYEAKLITAANTEDVLPSFITFNSASREFQVETSDESNNGTYVIKLTGSL
jgi:guanyl-specific ribonuclease Sa